MLIPSPESSSAEPGSLHPRNRHGARYDFAALTAASPELSRWVIAHPAGGETVNFFDPAAVKALNRALLACYYGVIDWDIPPGYLCPPIPGRADYLHHLADLLAADGDGQIPRGPGTRILDLGVGANVVYPIIGIAEYDWRFTGTEVDRVALDSASRLVERNPCLAGKVEFRLQPRLLDVFVGVIRPGETFAASLCNPPFHASAADAREGAQRKLRNLGAVRGAEPVLNFGGQPTELWCAGGEIGFIQRMIAQSALLPAACRWFTTLVSKQGNLPAIDRALRSARARDVRIIELVHGQKKSRVVAWTFFSGAERAQRFDRG